jgi:hypothetical protein
MRWCGLDFPSYGGDCCEHGNGHSEIIEYMELFDWLSEGLTNVQGRLCSMESVHCEDQHDAVWMWRPCVFVTLSAPDAV